MAARPVRNEPLVRIASFTSGFEASIARGALEAIGIPALVPNEVTGMYSRNRGGLAHADLQVFESDRTRAIAELRRIQMHAVERPDPS